MTIDSQLQPIGGTPAASGAFGRRSNSEKTLQDVFAEVLQQAGRQGYASAEPVTTEAPISESITQSWNDWFEVSGKTRYQEAQSPQQLQQDFGQLLVQSHEERGYVAPQAFLASLSSDQLSTVQHVHHLVASIDVNGLTEEGALNLLLPPPAQVDLNNDGLTQSGIGYTIRFPDSRTPAPVAAAWEEATANLDEGERAIRQLQMKLPVLLANIHLDAEGRFSHRVEPGDPNFVNPMADPGYSFLRLTRESLDASEYFKNQTPPEQYKRDQAFWTAFQSALLEHGAN